MGGVHPYLIDKVSCALAKRLRQFALVQSTAILIGNDSKILYVSAKLFVSEIYTACAKGDELY